MATMRVTVVSGFERHGVTGTPATSESLADRGLPFAGMGGAVGGGFAAFALGADFGAAYPVVVGTLGTMLGSVFLACGWCAAAASAARFVRGG